NPKSKIQNEEVLDLLARLVEKSLVQYDTESGTGRYRLLETVRHYAVERLREAGETPSMRDRHRAFFLGLAEAAALPLQGVGQEEWLARLTAEEDNLRVALEWSVEAVGSGGWLDVEMAPRQAAALGLFWLIRSSFTEGRRWLTGLLEGPAGTAAAARARLLT